jgi:hypothetical protein
VNKIKSENTRPKEISQIYKDDVNAPEKPNPDKKKEQYEGGKFLRNPTMLRNVIEYETPVKNEPIRTIPSS